MLRSGYKANLIPIPVEGLFHRVGVDCLGPLLVTASGNRCIVVFTDYFTRWPEAFAVPTIDAQQIAKLLLDNIIARHSAPRVLLSDRGKNFLNDSVKFFKVQVRQPYSPRTPISLYHCTAEIRQFKCHEKFFGQTSEHYSVQQTVVSKQDCITAILRNTSPFGPLVRASHNRWITRNNDHYSCSWLKIEVNHFTHFTVTSYHGELIADD